MSSKQVLITDMVDPESIDQIPKNIQDFYNDVSKSMLKQIRKRGIRKFSVNHIERWVRINFPINEDQLVVEKHKMVAAQVSKYLLRRSTDYKIPLNEVRALLELDQLLQTEKEREEEKFRKIKSEVEELRNQKRKLKKPRSKVVVKRSISNYKPLSKLKETPKITSPVQGIDYDHIYKPWMSHVETKSTSKSYWYIHEYIGRYILNFAIKRNAKSINKEIVQEFLDDYGRGKAAKTMNHYNRVAKYFLEFCLKLQ
ncbi:MAG: hypothetical protein ACXAC2_12085 [Candidatus Kariarchaeaceae archaeon]|jgi:hypothetical protein